MLKGILYFFGGCLLIGLILSFGLSKIPALSMAGKSILIMLSQHQYEQAYNYFSKDFKSRYSLPIFTKMVDESGLTHYEDVAWTKEIISKDKKKGYLAGTVKTTQNLDIAIEMDFVNEAGAGSYAPQWMIKDLRVKKQSAIAP